MKQIVKSIHPLCWFLLGWLVTGWIAYWIHYYRNPLIPLSTLAVATLIVVVPCALYWLGLSRPMRRSSQYFLLFVQAMFVLGLTQLTRDPDVCFVFSLVLIVAIIDLLKQLRPIFLVAGLYLALLFLYAWTFGSQITWLYLWRGDNYVSDIPALLILAGIVIYMQQKRAHARTQELLRELNAAHAQLSAYALRVEELTMLTERQRLARELHDTLTQGVAGVVMQLEAANSYFGKNQVERAREIMLSAMSRARTALTETRYVLQDLRADRPRADDLPEMVQEEVERFSEHTGIPCVAELDALAVTPDAHGGHILRAISEGLANVARHAQARRVWICAQARDGLLHIEVRDNGVGFDPATARSCPGHYGLAGLHERVRLIGGQLDILSSPGHGTRIRIGVPISAQRRCA